MNDTEKQQVRDLAVAEHRISGQIDNVETAADALLRRERDPEAFPKIDAEGLGRLLRAQRQLAVTTDAAFARLALDMPEGWGQGSR